MNAEDLNDICGRAVRGAPIDADHVLEIIADLTAAEARLKAVIALCDQEWYDLNIKAALSDVRAAASGVTP